MIFETHAHYDDEKFDTDRVELLSSMKEAGIGHVINVGALVRVFILHMNMISSSLQQASIRMTLPG